MDLLEELFRSEQGKDPRLIAMKRKKMAADILGFYRGAEGLFHALWTRQHPGPTPAGWICGDAHWENVGSYKGKNHVAYFDFTDFDNACLAPLGFDLGRAATCMYLLDKPRLAPIFLASYREDLAAGKPYHIEAEVADGIVARLLRKVTTRSQRKFMREHAQDGLIKVVPGETFRLPRAERAAAARVFKLWARTMPNPEFFRLMDLCGGSSGVGELGLRRYLVLVEGHNSPHLIDMKEAAPSAAAPYSFRGQPVWKNEAERIAEAQRMVQYVPIARLGWSRAPGRSYVFSEYQPAEDRVDSMQLSKREYVDFAEQWGKLLAWSHLRGGGWKGAATTSDLVAFGQAFNSARQRRLLAAARATAARLQGLFADYRRVVGAAAD